jgi:hypothetical protein
MDTRHCKTIILAGLLLSISFSSYGAVTGNALLEACEGRGNFDGVGDGASAMACTMFFTSYIEAANYTSALIGYRLGTVKSPEDAVAKKIFCPEKHPAVTPDQVKRMIQKTANENPEWLSENVGVIMYRVLGTLFPCK